MSNSFFQFKQFRIEQDRTAMKVCTDSCILGALVDPSSAKTILDIGTGTGLLALMLAQKSSAVIDAVEIEEDAFLQAQKNIGGSPWKDRIQVHHISIQEYTVSSGKTFDLIISNPPFFKDQLRSPDDRVNIAHHDTGLSLQELAVSVSTLLDIRGKFYVLLPKREFEMLREIFASLKIFPSRLIFIKDNFKSEVFRVVGCFLKQESKPLEETLIIKNKDEKYSEDFVRLLSAYYLYL